MEGRTMKRLLGVTTATLALIVGLVASTTGPASATATISADRAHVVNGTLVDQFGRIIVPHGLNVVLKAPPYAPDAIGFSADDADFLVANGYTSVRLGIIWKGLEPTPGHYDDTYLNRIRTTARMLAARGIWVLLDFHQDMYSDAFQGDGAPDWATQTGGLLNPQYGFPFNYAYNPALNHAFDLFWGNAAAPDGIGLQTHFANAWAHVALFFASTQHIVGFDLFNEPWPGSTYPACSNPSGCAAQDAVLQKFQQSVIDHIRTVDARTTLFYEPYVTFNGGVSTAVAPRGTNLGFSFHDYCNDPQNSSTCAAADNTVMRHQKAHTAATGAAAMLTEFGATGDTVLLARIVDLAAAARLPWMNWAYTAFDPLTVASGGVEALVHDPRKPPKGTNIDWGKVGALAVPHPLAVAGSNVGWVYSRRTHAFTITWSTVRLGTHVRWRAGTPSVLELPAFFYPHGNRIQVSGGYAMRGANVTVTVRQAAGATTMTVRITTG